jgi:2-polyprenyl-6-methoxyphenol hydroxylase-like FAD-dependent oxidoreductase
MSGAQTQVLIAGGGPVGLATAVELGRRGIRCVVVEPRAGVTHARPRCKTVNVRTMEHLRRWGIADELRRRAPLPVSWSQDVVFCTTLTGHELSRFHGVLGLATDGDRYPEPGQQAPQYVLEELLRETVAGLDPCTLLTGRSVAALDQEADEVRVALSDGSVITADYVVGADGPRSTVRDQIGASYVGEHALKPNFGAVFHAPRLRDHVRHGPAVQYWAVNPDVPALVGPLDRDGTWWMIAFGVDRETGERDPQRLVRGAVGLDVDVTISSTDPWTARMQHADTVRRDRVFLAGDAAHLNPPFGGHGLNTGIGDAVDLGWKLATVLGGHGGEALLDSYAAERRPIQDAVIRAATANMAVGSPELLSADLDADGAAGSRARAAAHARIQETKHAEFHALDLVLDQSFPDSPVVAPGTGHRLPHGWLDATTSIYDALGDGFALVVTAGPGVAGAPLPVLDLRGRGLRERYGHDLLLVRPDQHVAWAGSPVHGDVPDLTAVLDHARGLAPVR